METVPAPAPTTSGAATTPDGEVSAEQREFEEQQKAKPPRRDAGRGRGDRPERGRERPGDRGERGRGRDRDRGERPARSPEVPATSTPAAASADVKTLMVTLGKRQKMGPREVGLFMVGAAGIDVSQVKDVRVRDTYSFVDVDTGIADAVIAKVNGAEHDGKKIKVELARARAEAPKP